MRNFIYSKEIKSTFIEVSEEIENKNLKKFIFTSLKLKNIFTNKDDFINVTFISELKQYQVLIFPNDKKRNVIFEIYQLFYLEKNNIENFDLYFAEEFFCLYKNSKFYYFQNLDSKFVLEDLIAYINKKFSIVINDFKIIKNNIQEELQNDYLDKNIKSTLLNINKNNSYSFNIFLFYICIVVILFSFFNQNYNHSNENNQNLHIEESLEKNLSNLKEKYLFNSFYEKYEDLNKIINTHNLKINSFEYRQNISKISIYSTNKNDIYSFLNEEKKKLISYEINYFENQNIYELIVNVKLFQ